LNLPSSTATDEEDFTTVAALDFGATVCEEEAGATADEEAGPIGATEEELAAHEAVLQGIEKENKGKACLWRNGQPDSQAG